MTFKFVALGILAIHLLMGGAVRAAEAPPRFGVIDWFPFGSVVSGKKEGIFIEIIDAFDQALAIKSEVVVASAPRVYRGVRAGEFDFTFSYRDTANQEEFDHLVDIGCLRPAVISLKRDPISAVSQLNGRRVAYPSIGYFVRRVLPTLEIEGFAVHQTDIMFKMALRGRLEAFIVNDAVWEAYRHNLHPDFRVPKTRWRDFSEPVFIDTLPVAISMSRNTIRSGLVSRIHGIMKEPKFIEELERIYKKYHLPKALDCLQLNSALD